MKIQSYIGLVAVSLLLFACGKDTVGFLVADEARYEPDSMTIRNIPIFKEIEGWTTPSGVWEMDEDDPRYDLYVNDWTDNASSYTEDSIPWVGTPMQGIIGTTPIQVTLHSVVSPDGGDVEVFKQKVDVWGDGTVEVPAMSVPEGTYVLTMKISAGQHSYIMKSPYIVKVKGKVPDGPITFD